MHKETASAWTSWLSTVASAVAYKPEALEILTWHSRIRRFAPSTGRVAQPHHRYPLRVPVDPSADIIDNT